MSEEILKALMQLFAIIIKQEEIIETSEINYVKNFLNQQLSDEAAQEYFNIFETTQAGKNDEVEEKKSARLTSVKDSVKILSICKRINKTLNQKQKAVVLVRLFELVNSGRKFTEKRMVLINTVAEVFNIPRNEVENIETFVIKNRISDLDNTAILIINSQDDLLEHSKHIISEELDGNLLVLRIKSVDLYFLRYTGTQDVFLNGLPLNNRRIYLYAAGSTVKPPIGKPVYYSDVIAKFLSDVNTSRLSFIVDNLSFKFPNGTLGLRNISFSEEHGRLIGIMGASGAGKTTLLNVLSGIEKPSAGEIRINGINLHTEKEKLDGVIGYIPQDDLLIEDLTVFENLYYASKLCFKNKTKKELIDLVNKTLHNLGLYERKDLKVGSPLNKMISGGQRKRLNIALELIREPAILFVDEPTSGLSSRDSENVMDLLNELALKGKLIYTVIHQPSSDIYKKFDKMMILDTGGYLIYHGNPIEAIVYFKKLDNQLNSEIGECPTCGNVNPELIFNTIESRVVDEFGKYTNQRKNTPIRWEELYHKHVRVDPVKEVKEEPGTTLNIPGWFTQLRIYATRDLKSKLSNSQYILLNFLEAPLLAFILSFIIRYIADPTSNTYIFRENVNVPPYIFMSIVVALFLGLTVSAEEIFKDRKILKREKFLNLSRSSYLISKVMILIMISAVQSYLFVLVGNNILGIKGMNLYYWFALFTMSSSANMLGLNISASFNSAVTIYIVIPLIMIPQMILGGAMFSFDKLNSIVGTVGKVPLIAEFMPSRWIYEALMVHQYKNNAFEKDYFNIEKRESVADFKTVNYLPELSARLENCVNVLLEDKEESKPEAIQKAINDLALLRNEISKEIKKVKEIPFYDLNLMTQKSFSNPVAENIALYLQELDSYYTKMFKQANDEKDKIIRYLDEKQPGYYKDRRKSFHNEALTEYVRNVWEKNKIVQYKDDLIQQSDLIYIDPDDSNPINFRTHFYSPTKFFANKFFETFWFNMTIVWLITLLFYVTLYFEYLSKLLNLLGKLKPKKTIKIPLPNFKVLIDKIKRKKTTVVTTQKEH